MMMKQKWLLPLILLLAITLRLALALTHPFSFPDSADYDTLARAVAHSQPYEVHGLFATRIPGYPLFIAALYTITPSIRLVLIIQSLLGGLTTYLVYLIARRISEPTALLAALLAALDPLSIGFSVALLSESLFTILLLLALWLLIKQHEPHQFRWWPLLGLTWAAAVYMRASALWCIVPLLAWSLITQHRTQKIAPRFLGALLAFALVLLTLLPWELRNYAIFHESFTRLTTLEGVSLYEAVYPGADGSPKQDTLILPPEMSTMNESQRNNEYARRAWHDIFADPLRIATLALRKIARTWSLTLNAANFQNPLVQLLMVLWHLPLFILALIGLLKKGIPPTLKGLLLIPILYFTAVHALFLGSVRYRVPLMPLICLFAAAGIMQLVKPRRSSKPPAPAGV
jgi:4-amino-4-deoxy-L-arabinose transferase-like glycosyltransferase